MLTAYSLPDYCARFFEYKDLEKIHGQPTIDSIARLLRQIKRNAQRVHTTLGGGQLGYLALVLSTVDYNTIPNSAHFNRPTDPGVFSPAPIGPVLRGAQPLSAAEIATLKITYDENLRQYNECQAVENALRNQIISAIESDYLQPIRNIHTDMINESIPQIITFLRDTYGQLSPSQLKERERAIDDMIYNPATTIDSVFNKIQEFQDICILLQNTKTDMQLITYAYLVFQRAGIFMTSLKEWNAKSIASKTFQTFKIFMRKQYLDLEAVGGLMIQNSSLNMMQELKNSHEHFANTLKHEVQSGIRETMQALNLASQQENINPNLGFCAPVMTPTQWASYGNQFVQNSDQNFEEPPPLQQMFGATESTNPMMVQMLQKMQAMQQQISGLTLTNQQLSQSGSQNPTTNKGGNNLNKDLNPKTGLPWKRYCWSCGCCAHWGKNCAQKKRGHKDDASFKTRMGGSNENCM